MNAKRQIIFHEQYFAEFYLEQSEKVQEKIEYVFMVLKTVQKSSEKIPATHDGK